MVDTHSYDVVVIGAGGAGLRAAIEAHDAGARVLILRDALRSRRADIAGSDDGDLIDHESCV